MQAVRDRLEYGTPAEGEAKGPASEPDASIHKQLTRTFKEVSKTMGADKPSALQESQFAEFIERINAISIVDNRVVPF